MDLTKDRVIDSTSVKSIANDHFFIDMIGVVDRSGIMIQKILQHLKKKVWYKNVIAFFILVY